jgi:hypothetical protein
LRDVHLAHQFHALLAEGLFRTKPRRQLVVGPYQMAVLRKAGCLPQITGAKERGNKFGDVSSRRG